MSSILFEVRDGIGWIILNRPEKLNSFNREMALAMQKALAACESAEVRCVHITGAGKAFSAGQDLAEVINPDGPGMERILSEHYNPIIRKIRNLPKPVIAAVNGVAAGAGANIALSCDVVIASEAASFIQAFSKIGLIPDSGGTHVLPRLIGFQKASALMMMGEKVSAQDAERMGMVYRVYAPDVFEHNCRDAAIYLAAMPTLGLAYTKQALNKAMTNTLEEQLETEDHFQQLAASTQDYKEGVDAFINKRKANFSGK